MTLFYYDPRCLYHDTGRFHPERPQRLRETIEHLEATDVLAKCVRPKWDVVPRQRLLRAHEAGHVDRVFELAEAGGRLDPDTVVSRDSPVAAGLSAGAACDAVDRVMRGEDKTAFCLVRPPGHHALPERAMGFCLFNNIAVAARVAMEEYGVERALIVDWDVHHGNGTQDAFYDDPRVGFFSIHRWPFYPGTGADDETGTGDGLGTTRNVPASEGISREDYADAFRNELEAFASKMRPQLVLVSAGFDAHRTDPLGSFVVETEDFATMTQVVLDVARTHAEGRVVSMLEGGYNPPVLAECVEAHMRELLGAS